MDSQRIHHIRHIPCVIRIIHCTFAPMITSHILTLVRAVFCLTVSCMFVSLTIAQRPDWNIGFELGWSNSKIIGDDYQSINGSSVETRDFASGFNLSLYARKHFTDGFGVQFGLSYSQRGGEVNYNGPSYYRLGFNQEEKRILALNRNESLRIQNSYLDVPIVAFHRIGSKFEIGAGVYAGMIIVSKGDGDSRMTPLTNGTPFDPFIIGQEHNYLRDLTGDAVLAGVQDIIVGSRTYNEPRVLAAYYETYEGARDKNFYRSELGALAQIGYYFNTSLNIKARATYGLTDITRNSLDWDKSTLDSSNNQIYRDDKDRHISFQLLLGFMF